MYRFNVGDKVRCISRKGTNYYNTKIKEHPYVIGNIYTVDYNHGDGYIAVKEVDVGEYDSCFELYKQKEKSMEKENPFKIGDKVRYVTRFGSNYGMENHPYEIGKVYEVSKVFSNDYIGVNGVHFGEYTHCFEKESTMKKLSKVELDGFGIYRKAVEKLLVEDLKCVEDDRDNRVKLSDLAMELKDKVDDFENKINAKNGVIVLELPINNSEWSLEMFRACEYAIANWYRKYGCYIHHPLNDVHVIKLVNWDVTKVNVNT